MLSTELLFEVILLGEEQLINSPLLAGDKLEFRKIIEYKTNLCKSAWQQVIEHDTPLIDECSILIDTNSGRLNNFVLYSASKKYHNYIHWME